MSTGISFGGGQKVRPPSSSFAQRDLTMTMFSNEQNAHELAPHRDHPILQADRTVALEHAQESIVIALTSPSAGDPSWHHHPLTFPCNRVLPLAAEIHDPRSLNTALAGFFGGPPMDIRTSPSIYIGCQTLTEVKLLLTTRLGVSLGFRCFLYLNSCRIYLRHLHVLHRFHLYIIIFNYLALRVRLATNDCYTSMNVGGCMCGQYCPLRDAVLT